MKKSLIASALLLSSVPFVDIHVANARSGATPTSWVGHHIRHRRPHGGFSGATSAHGVARNLGYSARPGS